MEVPIVRMGAWRVVPSAAEIAPQLTLRLQGTSTLSEMVCQLDFSGWACPYRPGRAGSRCGQTRWSSC